MRERLLVICIVFFATACVFAKEACCKEMSVERLMEKIAEKGSELESFSANIMYSLTEDPEIFETTTIYTGTFNYLKTEQRQYAMIDFITRQEDELPVEDYHQRYVFDGVWLTRIDYQLKQVNKDQLVPEDEPEDVFKLIGEDFPLMGFSGTDRLSDRYDIEFEQSDDSRSYELNLTPKEQSDVKYSEIRFVIDSGTLLPRSIKAVSSSDSSICDIQLDGSVINTELNEEIFKVEIPDDFTVSENKLEKK
ncbi:MAG: outer membrane lipoprotein carrier protein LolA [Sedimentisphaeraceae bacterium JB056]